MKSSGPVLVRKKVGDNEKGSEKNLRKDKRYILGNKCQEKSKRSARSCHGNQHSASKQATIWLNKKGHELFKEEDARN